MPSGRGMAAIGSGGTPGSGWAPCPASTSAGSATRRQCLSTASFKIFILTASFTGRSGPFPGKFDVNRSSHKKEKMQLRSFLVLAGVIAANAALVAPTRRGGAPALPVLSVQAPFLQPVIAAGPTAGTSCRTSCAPTMMARAPPSKPGNNMKSKTVQIRSKDKNGKEFDGFVSEQGSASYYFTWTVALGIYALMFYGIASKMQS